MNSRAGRHLWRFVVAEIARFLKFNCQADRLFIVWNVARLTPLLCYTLPQKTCKIRGLEIFEHFLELGARTAYPIISFDAARKDLQCVGYFFNIVLFKFSQL